MSYKTDLQGNNTDLQTVLSKVNALPSGSALGDATAADVVSGKTFSSASGIKVTGSLVPVEVQYVTNSTQGQTLTVPGLIGKDNFVLFDYGGGKNMGSRQILYVSVLCLNGVIDSAVVGHVNASATVEEKNYLTFNKSTGTFTISDSNRIFGRGTYGYIAW